MSRRTPTPGKWIRQDRAITLEEVAWLHSGEGAAVMRAMEEDPADTPAAIEKWRERLDAEQVAAAWHQVVLRHKARSKFSRADEMLFDRVSLEQSTDEVVARYKARRYAECARVADLCCGMGGDALALAEHADVTVMDWSAVRVELASHNVSVYGHEARTRVGDVTFDLPACDAIHIDPDRRADGAKRHDAVQASPDIEVVWRIVRDVEHAGVKLSPGADFSGIPVDHELELISHHGECKQAMIWTGTLARVGRSATVLPTGERIEAQAEEDLSWPERVEVRAGDVLHEPDGAVIRAGLVGVLARKYGLAPLDAWIAYLIGARAIESELLTAFRVIDVQAWSGKSARAWLRSHDMGDLEIKTRGFAARPEDLRRGLKLKGKRRGVLFVTRVGEAPMAILAERL